MARKRQRPTPRLFVYGVSQEEWTRRYGVEPFSHLTLINAHR